MRAFLSKSIGWALFLLRPNAELLKLLIEPEES